MHAKCPAIPQSFVTIGQHSSIRCQLDNRTNHFIVGDLNFPTDGVIVRFQSFPAYEPIPTSRICIHDILGRQSDKPIWIPFVS